MKTITQNVNYKNGEVFNQYIFLIRQRLFPSHFELKSQMKGGTKAVGVTLKRLLRSDMGGLSFNKIYPTTVYHEINKPDQLLFSL